MTVHWYAASNRFTVMALNDDDDNDDRYMCITNGTYLNWEKTTEVQEEPITVPLTCSITNVIGLKPSATGRI